MYVLYLSTSLRSTDRHEFKGYWVGRTGKSSSVYKGAGSLVKLYKLDKSVDIPILTQSVDAAKEYKTMEGAIKAVNILRKKISEPTVTTTERKYGYSFCRYNIMVEDPNTGDIIYSVRAKL